MEKEYAISSGTGENRTSKKVSLTQNFGGLAKYFTVLDRHAIKVDKNKMDWKFIKPHPNALCWKDIMLYFDWNLSWILIKTYSTKTDSYRSTSHNNLQKQNNEDFLIELFCPSLHLTNNNNPPPYLQKKSLFNPYL